MLGELSPVETVQVIVFEEPALQSHEIVDQPGVYELKTRFLLEIGPYGNRCGGGWIDQGDEHRPFNCSKSFSRFARTIGRVAKAVERYSACGFKRYLLDAVAHDRPSGLASYVLG